MGIVDAIDVAAKNLWKRNGGKPLTGKEIIDETLKHGEWSRGSIMPYDFCYNHENQGSRPAKYKIFKLVGRDLYEYVGRSNENL